ncbi:MAG: hypothetical protein ABDH20_11805 [Thermus sp.]
MEWLTNPEVWIAFLTLTVLEVVLGVDNVILFISILASKLPKEETWGLGGGDFPGGGHPDLFLLSIAWIMACEEAPFCPPGPRGDGKDLVLIAGGFSSSTSR